MELWDRELMDELEFNRPDDYETDICSFCNGTGEGHASDTTCPYCHGLGRIVN